MNMAILSCSPIPIPIVAPPLPPPRRYFSSPRCRQHTEDKDSRRYLLGTSLAGAFLVATSLDTPTTTPTPTPTPDYPPKSQLIEQLLERSRANKAKYDQERLDSYYERNYKEYFEFVEGTIKNKSELTETEKGILKWLEKIRSKKK